VRIQQSGNLSSLQWTQSPEAAEGVEKHEMYTVCYSALNFRDVMLATGKLSPAANPGKNTNPEQMLGMEFSGLNTFGKRVMGLVSDLKVKSLL
jgi:fatty acid synthase